MTTSIILAGGKSSRLGRNKAFKTINDKNLVQHMVDRLSPLSKEIIIVTAQNEDFSYLSSPSILKTVADIYPNKGPLCGIYSGLAISSCPRATIVGCDMPFINVALLNYMNQLSPAFDVVVPHIGENIEPLCAIYSKNCLVPIHELLEHNELMISKLFSIVKVRYIEEHEINRFDPEHLSFFNINTRADLNKARKIATEKRSPTQQLQAN